MRLLLVEDEEDVRSMVAEFLRDEGYHIAEAANAADARRLLNSAGHQIDLVITDVRMPGETGVQLAKHIRQNYPNVQVLLASGNVTDAEVGGEPFIMKPFPLGRLAAMISDILEGQR